ncbi:unnamed protein product [Miscanthus lutarioriparius]|uniref:MACPF domain-containing protein n=1 Tax=Miscanthus lutarioriparius TaxID=422564 RepID=A0A811NML0_9POAL|nr:unnamed protein product [Miscanthus lutarioriparius]
MAARRATPQEAAEAAIRSVGLGFDVVSDVRLKYCKQRGAPDPWLIELDHGEAQDIVLPGGVTVAGVTKSVKCDKGERMRFRSDVLSFQQMSEQFNQELSLSGKIPSGFFNTMFEFSGSWQKDAANTKTLAFDGWYVTLYSVALSKGQIVLRDHVKQAVPSTWEPAALARFIEKFGTHIVVGLKMGGKDVIYLKQQHSSTLQAADVQKRLKEMSDRKFFDANGQSDMGFKDTYGNNKSDIREQQLRFVQSSPLNSYSSTEVDVGKRPVTGLRLFLEGRKSNKLAIHLQHLCSLPQIIQLEDDPYNHQIPEYDRKYYEPIGPWKRFSHVCTAPVESDDLSIVTGAQLDVVNHGLKKILFLRLHFSKACNVVVRNSEWENSPNLAQKSGLISTLISTHFSSVAQKPPPRPADVNINSAVYPGGPPVPVQTPKLLKFVDPTEMMRGPQDSPGYWVVSGAKLNLERGKISLRVKYSLLTAMMPDDESLDDDEF